MTQQRPKISVMVLMGGYTSEFDISLKSGTVVCTELDTEKYDVYPCVITKNQWYYKENESVKHNVDPGSLAININGKLIHPDVVFNTIHGSPGEDGYIAALCELLNIPQTSTHFYAAALSFNKRDCLSVLKAHGIPCAESIYCDLGHPSQFKEVAEKLGLPFFVKPNRSGSSYGVSKVNTEEAYQKALETAFAEDHQILIERALSGVEISVGAYSYQGKPIILTPTEIVSENDFFDYAAKYEGQSQEITPADLPASWLDQVKNWSEMIYNRLELRGVVRSEFIFVEGVPHLLEINTVPGMTARSIIPQQVEAMGMNLKEFFTLLLKEALTENQHT